VHHHCSCKVDQVPRILCALHQHSIELDSIHSVCDFFHPFTLLVGHLPVHPDISGVVENKEPFLFPATLLIRDAKGKVVVDHFLNSADPLCKSRLPTPFVRLLLLLFLLLFNILLSPNRGLLLLDQRISKIVPCPLLLPASSVQRLLSSSHHRLLLRLPLLLVPRLMDCAPLGNYSICVLPPLLLLLLGEAGQVQARPLRFSITSSPNGRGDVGYLRILRHEESIEDQVFPSVYRYKVGDVTKTSLVHDHGLQGEVSMALLL